MDDLQLLLAPLHMLTPVQWLIVVVCLGALNAVLDLLGVEDQ